MTNEMDLKIITMAWLFARLFVRGQSLKWLALARSNKGAEKKSKTAKVSMF